MIITSKDRTVTAAVDPDEGYLAYIESKKAGGTDKILSIVEKRPELGLHGNIFLFTEHPAIHRVCKRRGWRQRKINIWVWDY